MACTGTYPIAIGGCNFEEGELTGGQHVTAFPKMFNAVSEITSSYGQGITNTFIDITAIVPSQQIIIDTTSSIYWKDGTPLIVIDDSGVTNDYFNAFLISSVQNVTTTTMTIEITSIKDSAAATGSNWSVSLFPETRFENLPSNPLGEGEGGTGVTSIDQLIANYRLGKKYPIKAVRETVPAGASFGDLVIIGKNPSGSMPISPNGIALLDGAGGVSTVITPEPGDEAFVIGGFPSENANVENGTSNLLYLDTVYNGGIFDDTAQWVEQGGVRNYSSKPILVYDYDTDGPVIQPTTTAVIGRTIFLDSSGTPDLTGTFVMPDMEGEAGFEYTIAVDFINGNTSWNVSGPFQYKGTSITGLTLFYGDVLELTSGNGIHILDDYIIKNITRKQSGRDFTNLKISATEVTGVATASTFDDTENLDAWSTFSSGTPNEIVAPEWATSFELNASILGVVTGSTTPENNSLTVQALTTAGVRNRIDTSTNIINGNQTFSLNTGIVPITGGDTVKLFLTTVADVGFMVNIPDNDRNTCTVIWR